MERPKLSSERGAILIYVAASILVLVAFSSFAVDYGVMLVGRRQAQNAADAGALAAAVALAFDTNGWTNRTETGPARVAGREMALQNAIWGQQPDIEVDSDVFFTALPGAAQSGPCLPDLSETPCVRVNVYRNQTRGNPLPALFGRAAGLTEQGVRATATAAASVGNASSCLKPWAIPDKWDDVHDETAPVDQHTWTADDRFERVIEQGRDRGELLPDPDVYVAPSQNGPGTGFTLANDLGTEVILKFGTPADAIAPGYFLPVRLPGDCTQGGDCYREHIAACNGATVEIGDSLVSEPGNMIGPTLQGVEALRALDPDATWDPTTHSVVGSCAEGPTPCAARSPRIVAIPVFDTRAYYDGQRNGSTTIHIVNILGFFIDRIEGNDVVGYLTMAPGLTVGESEITPESSFLRSITLVR